MFLWIYIFGWIVAFFVAYFIGANDSANSWATTYAARPKTISLTTIIILGSLFEFGGAVLLGAEVTKAIGGSIADVDKFQSQPASVYMYAMLCVLIATMIWLAIATITKLPISTSHSVTSAVVGVALVFGGTESVNWLSRTDEFPYVNGLVFIVLGWIISPLLSGAVSAGTFALLRWVILRVDLNNAALAALGDEEEQSQTAAAIEDAPKKPQQPEEDGDKKENNTTEPTPAAGADQQQQEDAPSCCESVIAAIQRNRVGLVFAGIIFVAIFVNLFFILSKGMKAKIKWEPDQCAWVSIIVALGCGVIAAIAAPVMLRIAATAAASDPEDDFLDTDITLSPKLRQRLMKIREAELQRRKEEEEAKQLLREAEEAEELKNNTSAGGGDASGASPGAASASAEDQPDQEIHQINSNNDVPPARPFVQRAEQFTGALMSFAVFSQSVLSLVELMLTPPIVPLDASLTFDQQRELVREREEQAGAAESVADYNNSIGEFAMSLCFLSLFFTSLPVAQPTIEKIWRNIKKRWDAVWDPASAATRKSVSGEDEEILLAAAAVEQQKKKKKNRKQQQQQQEQQQEQRRSPRNMKRLDSLLPRHTRFVFGSPRADGGDDDNVELLPHTGRRDSAVSASPSATAAVRLSEMLLQPLPSADRRRSSTTSNNNSNDFNSSSARRRRSSSSRQDGGGGDDGHQRQRRSTSPAHRRNSNSNSTLQILQRNQQRYSIL